MCVVGYNEQLKAPCILKTRVFQLEVIEMSLGADYYLILSTVITRDVKDFLEKT